MKGISSFDISKLEQMSPEFLTTLGCRQVLKSKDIMQMANDIKNIDKNHRCVSGMKFELNKAVKQWNDRQADKEAIE